MVSDSLGNIIPIDFREFSKQKINALSSIVLNPFKPILCMLNVFGLGFSLYIRGVGQRREQQRCLSTVKFASSFLLIGMFYRV